MENSKGQNRNDRQQVKSKDQQRERLSNSERLHGKQNTSGGMRHGSSDRIDEVRDRNSTRSGSGISTKRNVSGSEYDGQVSPE